MASTFVIFLLISIAIYKWLLPIYLTNTLFLIATSVGIVLDIAIVSLVRRTIGPISFVNGCSIVRCLDIIFVPVIIAIMCLSITFNIIMIILHLNPFYLFDYLVYNLILVFSIDIFKWVISDQLNNAIEIEFENKSIHRTLLFHLVHIVTSFDIDHRLQLLSSKLFFLIDYFINQFFQLFEPHVILQPFIESVYFYQLLLILIEPMPDSVQVLTITNKLI